MALPKPDLSLKRGLTLLWLAILGVALALATLAWALSRQGAEALVGRAALQAGDACIDLARTLEQARALQGVVVAERSRTDALIDLALRDRPGIEGGIWLHHQGIVGYAFPTYDGSGVKRDVPAAERERIETMAERALSSQMPVTDIRPGLREAVVLHACPTGIAGYAGWTLTRVSTVTADSLDRLVLALALLVLFVVFSGLWLGWTLTRWTGGLRQVIDGLRQAGAEPGRMLKVEPTGLADLDRVAEALNDYAARLHAAQAAADRLQTDLVQSQRLAALGRMSAGLAHEIRNPLGAVRLKAENALAASGEGALQRSRSALEVIVEQTERVERLVASLLALTQPFHVQRRPVSMTEWLHQRCQLHAEAARRSGIDLVCRVDDATDLPTPRVVIDPDQVARALDNLVLNAFAHTGSGDRVEVHAWMSDRHTLCMAVEDTGPGVPPELMEHLFEPFSTGRPGGTGLGLALVREIVQAHQGLVRHEAVQPHGARFTMEFPCPVS